MTLLAPITASRALPLSPPPARDGDDFEGRPTGLVGCPRRSEGLRPTANSKAVVCSSRRITREMIRSSVDIGGGASGLVKRGWAV